jgi:hypothetical protein
MVSRSGGTHDLADVGPGFMFGIRPAQISCCSVPLLSHPVRSHGCRIRAEYSCVVRGFNSGCSQ